MHNSFNKEWINVILYDYAKSYVEYVNVSKPKLKIKRSSKDLTLVSYNFKPSVNNLANLLIKNIKTSSFTNVLYKKAFSYNTTPGITENTVTRDDR